MPPCKSLPLITPKKEKFHLVDPIRERISKAPDMFPSTCLISTGVFPGFLIKKKNKNKTKQKTKQNKTKNKTKQKTKKKTH